MKKINQLKCEFRITQIFEDKITNIKYKLKKAIDWYLTDWFFNKVSSVNQRNSLKDAVGRKF